jgi:predicted dehydrogenase
VTLRANTGPLPRESWVHDPHEGGGPIVGEACHFVDLAQALTRSVPVRSMRSPPPCRREGATNDVVITLEMADGSLATIVYTTGGDKTFQRERSRSSAEAACRSTLSAA